MFEALGGTQGFVQWARANPSDFYLGFLARSMPKELDVSGTITHEFDFDNARQEFESALSQLIRARRAEEDYPKLVDGGVLRGDS